MSRLSKFLFLVILPIGGLVGYLLYTYKSPFQFMYVNEPVTDSIYLSTYTSNSRIEILSKDLSSIRFHYKLKPGTEFTTANVAFYLKDTSYFDVSEYDYLKIKIKASKGTRIPIILPEFVEHHSKPENPNSHRPLHKILEVTNHFGEYKIPLSEFEDPDWWYIGQNKVENQFNPINFSKIKCVILSSCHIIARNEDDTIEVEELSFHVNYFRIILFGFAGLCVYYTIAFALYSLLIKKRKPIQIAYNKLDSTNYHEKEIELIENYLTTHFSNAELTIIDVQNAIGIHERKITQHLKKKYEIGFKQYLNLLRVNEAKKLLKETTTPVAEIACMVGYANTSYFVKVFKNYEGKSPIEFRNALQGEILKK